MHTNYRRIQIKSGFTVGHGSGKAGTFAWFKQNSAKRRRAKVADLLRNVRYDEIPTRYRRDILWNYW